MSKHIFISHASADDDFVKELRTQLEDTGLAVWVDSRNLRGGHKLAPEIESAIDQARHVIVVLSPKTINSPWVRQEIQHALEVEKQSNGEGYRVIPLLLPGVLPSALPLWFDAEPVGVKVELKTAGVNEAMPAILAALGERLSTDYQPAPKATAQRLDELVLRLIDPRVETIKGKRRAVATATVTYESADGSLPVESKRFMFTAPLGPIETNELRWYLEKYYLWPVGLFKDRAARVESQLPVWGQDLYRAALASDSAKETIDVWQNVSNGAARCFSIVIDRELPEGTDEDKQAVANEAASELLSLPWELLHDGGGYMFQGAHAVRVRRRLPNRRRRKSVLTGLPIRILLVSPRPEDDRATYIDHRLSARPLMDAIDSLGDLVKLTVLAPPTFGALEDALKEASEKGEPFDAVHFDGHGVFNREQGLGALCFEDPNDSKKLEYRASKLIEADKIASVMRDYRIPLVFLEACQTATQEKDPTASVAARLLNEGVASVVAMSHSVLVETAQRFVRAFYAELAKGTSTGTAMLAGQRVLYHETWRAKVMGAGDLDLQDWFVPVLYQEERDEPLITELLSEEVQKLAARQRRLRLGALPDEPKHKFQGRSRELLMLERLLIDAPYAVVQGQGGAGKTTLAVELARWLVRARRFRRAAFVSLEEYSDARGVLDRLGQQLLPAYSVAEFSNLEEAFQPVERALCDAPTIIVLDNFESLLASAGAAESSVINESREAILKLAQDLLEADSSTRIIFTSRERLPDPFDHVDRAIQLGRLNRPDAISLVSEVMKQEGLEPKADDPGGTPREIEELVDAVNCHARALELLARELAKQGVRATTQNLQRVMAELDRRHPGDRENSLYASIELSLRRLPAEMRENAKALGVFHGGFSLWVLAQVLELGDDDTETIRRLAAGLIGVGLAEDMDYGHLKLDPAISPYMLREMTEAEIVTSRTRWAVAMQRLTSFLYDEQFKDAQLAANLTQLEFPNLMGTLLWSQENETPENAVALASQIETLVSLFGATTLLALAVNIREQAAGKLGGWNHSRYLAESARVDRLIEQQDLEGALSGASLVLQHMRQAGEGAYPEASYDLASANFRYGRVLKHLGRAEAALVPLAESKQRLEALAQRGEWETDGMLATVMSETAETLMDLGRLEEAASLYEETITRGEKSGDRRGVAVRKSQLGTIRLLQERFTEALTSYEEAKKTFDGLGEPGSVAVMWHQIGMVHRKQEQFDLSERAYRQSLAINVRMKNASGEQGNLGELGILYASWGRMEDAVTFFQQAADACVKLRDLRNEGLTRNNLANGLIQLHRYDEARRELLRAIECKAPLGHAAHLWITWDILYDLEKATGNSAAADAAREKAIETYLSYRRAGGEGLDNVAKLITIVSIALETNQTEVVLQNLKQISTAESPDWKKILLRKLKAILEGDRSASLPYDDELPYGAVAELRLLLEQNPAPNSKT